MVPPALPAAAHHAQRLAETGDRSAQRTLVLVARHDAAHWSLLFHPGLSRWVGDNHPRLLEATDTTPPVMLPVIGGPLLVALGALSGSRTLRRAGATVSLGTAAVMAEVGSRSTVPGANDNLTGVATLRCAIARRTRTPCRAMPERRATPPTQT